MSLADIYWFDEDTGQPRKPHARTHGDIGDELNSSLCPAHLHIYHTLKKIHKRRCWNRTAFPDQLAWGLNFCRVPGLTAPKKQKSLDF